MGKKLERASTGLPGLDHILQGGLPNGSITLLSGGCGTGKSTLAMQFLYFGAKYCDEPGVYVTLEEEPEMLIYDMSNFGWDIDGLIKAKKLMVIKPDVYKFDSIKQIMEDAIDRIRAKRLVVDSYSVMLTYFKDPYEIRNGLVQLDREIRKMHCSAIVISDTPDNSQIYSTTGLEEFIVDGVITLNLIRESKEPYEFIGRALTVRKMRATAHPLNQYRYEITSGGIALEGDMIGGAMSGKNSGGMPMLPAAMIAGSRKMAGRQTGGAISMRGKGARKGTGSQAAAGRRMGASARHAPGKTTHMEGKAALGNAASRRSSSAGMKRLAVGIDKSSVIAVSKLRAGKAPVVKVE